MIRCDKTKIIIFLNPKTGTTSLVNIFKQIPNVRCEHTHEFPTDFISLSKKYTFYTFYRNPIDRYFSLLLYIKRGQGFIESFLNHFYGLKLKIGEHKDYFALSDELKEKIEKISLEEMMYSDYLQDTFYFVGQKNFIAPNFVVKKSFHNFNEEVYSILEKFKLNYYPTITKENESVRLDSDRLSQEIKDRARQLYQIDFEYFDKQNIKWENNFYDKM